MGTVATDGNCTSNYDCVSGDTCSPIPGGTASVCASAGSSKALGDICAPGDTCQGSSYCAPVTNAEPKCTADPATGGACSTNVPCGTGNYCAGGTCAAQLQEGADNCVSNSDCTTGYCDLYVGPAPANTTQCTTGLTFARGSIDCNGIAMGVPTVADAGVNQDSGGGNEASTEAGSGGDAAGE